MICAQQGGRYGAVLGLRQSHGPQKLNRYNGVPSYNIQGQAAPGHSSGETMAEMEHLASKLPTGIGFEWTGLSFGA
jgi:multidrug efflux pump